MGCPSCGKWRRFIDTPCTLNGYCDCKIKQHTEKHSFKGENFKLIDDLWFVLRSHEKEIMAYQEMIEDCEDRRMIKNLSLEKEQHIDMAIAISNSIFIIKKQNYDNIP